MKSELILNGEYLVDEQSRFWNEDCGMVTAKSIKDGNPKCAVNARYISEDLLNQIIKKQSDEEKRLACLNIDIKYARVVQKNRELNK